MNADLPRFLTVKELDKVVPVSVAGVYREIHGARLASIKIGGKYIVPSRVLVALESSATGRITLEVPETVSATGRPFLTVAAAARLLRISPMILSREVRSNRFPAVMFSGKHLIPCRVIDDLEREALASMSLVDAATFTASCRATVANVGAAMITASCRVAAAS